MGSIRTKAAIGVTGHRVLTDLDRIEVGVDQALDRIEEKFPGQPITAISALAEGADRLVVECVLRRPGARIIVPMPLPVSEYLEDFDSEDSCEEFTRLLALAHEVVELPRSARRLDGYLAAGEYLLEHGNVLLAVWDGRAAQGGAGTSHVVAGARRRDLPIAWVHAGNRRPGTKEPTTLGADQGMVTLEGFGEVSPG